MKKSAFTIKKEVVTLTMPRPSNITHFADEIGVSRETVYNWLSKKCIPSKENLEKIKKYKPKNGRKTA